MRTTSVRKEKKKLQGIKDAVNVFDRDACMSKGDRSSSHTRKIWTAQKIGSALG